MRHSPFWTLGVLLLATAPLRADGPSCLLLHPTISPDVYTGSPGWAGPTGGVLDRCDLFTAPAPWGLTGADGIPFESIWYNRAQRGMEFWVGNQVDFSLTFWLQGMQVAQSVVTSPGTGWWNWAGDYDRIDVRGVHVLMVYEQGGTLIEPEAEEESLVAEPFSVVGQIVGEPQSTVPEPATMTLLGSGLVGLAAARRRRKHARAVPFPE